MGDKKQMLIAGNHYLEINGIQYQERPKPKPKRSSRREMMLFPFGHQGYYGERKQTPTPNVDIVAEFTLIQQKKSNLSRRDRDWVEWKFNKLYEKV